MLQNKYVWSFCNKPEFSWLGELSQRSPVSSGAEVACFTVLAVLNFNP